MKKKVTKESGNISKLTPKQQLFVAEYPKDFNATQAAIRAGYSEKTAKEQGYRLLTNVHIQKAVQGVLQDKTEEAGMSVQWVLNKYKTLIDRCMQVVPVMAKDGDGWKESGIFGFDSSVARAALADVGKYHKMFTDKVEHSGLIEVVKRDYSKGN